MKKKKKMGLVIGNETLSEENRKPPFSTET